MFIDKLPTTEPDVAIELAYHQLHNLEPIDDEYETVLNKIERLHKMKDTSHRVNPDTLVMAATNLVGILLILRFERIDIITSKALSFVSKTR